MIRKIVSEDYRNIAGLVVKKEGETVFEGQFNGFSAGDSFHVFSVTKSVVSALLGIAIGDGAIKSEEEKLLSFFPDYEIPAGEKYLQDLSIKDILTMTAPYKAQTENYEEFFSSGSWVAAALDFIGGGPSGKFRYAPIIGPDILTGIIARATGKPVLEYANERLFEPLGIKIPGSVYFKSKEDQFAFYEARTASGWVADPQGVNTAGWGLALSARDMSRFGELYLNNGMHEGKRVIPAAWVEKSTAAHSFWEKEKLHYGYLWGVLGGNCVAAVGDGGNAIYINRDERLTVAIASFPAPAPKDRIELIRGVIEPMFR